MKILGIACVLSAAMTASLAATHAIAQSDAAEAVPAGEVEAAADAMRAATEAFAEAQSAAQEGVAVDDASEMRARITRIENAFAQVIDTAEVLNDLDPAEQERVALETVDLVIPADVGAGSYACVADRAVAIRHEDDGTPVSGAVPPPETRFALTIAPADADDNFMNCMAITGADGDEIQDFCRDTSARIFQTSFEGRDTPWFGSLFSWANRIETGGNVSFMNGPSSLIFSSVSGAFRYTLSYSEPVDVPGGFTFDYVVEQGRCLAAD
ncbi:hypothetical protein RDV64_05800 [Acuticoccus sp. MNP-M23]|uniref:hypothetical protein n=1 Tax=Acuticoccus sp. MNP-M23 TaxID=3072793 RepID=UPI0028158474|nr:hypothetical protein [Acuticoccus sp. MNP-M23]WMS43904.1 hypothetical protein RDV64_05800 [Acuticoccus sp. MNP-M23]